MKLIDLQEMFSPSTTVKNARTKFKSKGYTPDWTSNELARGSFSIVKPDRTDPHMVYKRQMYKPENFGLTDAFDMYAEIIVRDSLWNMVHFPRIYNTTIVRDTENNSMRKWRIEQLIPLDGGGSIALLNSMHQRYFGTDGSIKDLTKSLGEIILSGEVNIIADPTLRKAVVKLIEVANEIRSKVKGSGSHLYLDIRVSNLMWRRTHTGLELVFSDPFALDMD